MLISIALVGRKQQNMSSSEIQTVITLIPQNKVLLYLHLKPTLHKIKTMEERQKSYILVLLTVVFPVF